MAVLDKLGRLKVEAYF